MSYVYQWVKIAGCPQAEDNWQVAKVLDLLGIKYIYLCGREQPLTEGLLWNMGGSIEYGEECRR